MNKKDNQRVRITKRIFRESLIKLLKSKSLYQITVRELCDIAELNRSTFYKYYGNIYDIFKEIENEIMEKNKIFKSQIDISNVNTAFYPIYKMILYIKDNAEVFSLIFNNSINDNFAALMIENSLELLRDTFYLLNIDNQIHKEYIFSYIISGSIDIIKNWINTGLKEKPEEIAELIHTIAAEILKFDVSFVKD